MPEQGTSVTGFGAPSDIDELLARQGPPDARSRLGEGLIRELREVGSTPVHAAVVVGDLRMSGLLLRESVSQSLYARFMVGFTEAVKGLTLQSDGWFDKFTGDGFIAFWIYSLDEPSSSLTIPRFCQSVLPAADSLLTSLKRNARNFPVGSGLALGLDGGPCELVRIGDSLTLVGSPIVGATRMVAGARPGQALVNISIGTVLERERGRLELEGMFLERTIVPTKEYPEGQEAYAIEFVRGTQRAEPHRGALDLTPSLAGK